MNQLFLKDIDKHNWKEAITLSVKEDQQQFIASNLYSIAEVQFLENFYAKGIFLDNKMIGFTMYGIDADDHNYWIYRFMIDKEFQGRGISLPAMQLLMTEIRRKNDTNIPVIMIGYHPDNIAAKCAYKKAGFIEGCLSSWGEQLAHYSLT